MDNLEAQNIDHISTYFEEYSQNTHQIIQSIKNCIKNLDNNQKIDFIQRLRIQYNLGEYLQDLVPLSNKFKSSLEDFLKSYTLVTLINYHQVILLKVTDNILLSSLSNYEELIKNLDILQKTLVYLIEQTQWELTLEGSKKAKEFLIFIIERWTTIIKNQTKLTTRNLINLLIAFFLKSFFSQESLIKSTVNENQEEREIALKIFNVVSVLELLEINIRYIDNVLEGLSVNSLDILKSWLYDTDEKLVTGSAIIWKSIIKSRNKETNIDSDITKKFISSTNSKIRQLGTVLVTWAEYPIEEQESKNLFLIGCKNAFSQEEEKAWSEMLSKIPMSEDKKLSWSNFLEDILANPRDYGTLILGSAMERYQKLNSAVNVTLCEEDEKRLGLP